MNSLNLELIREALKDRRLHLAIGQITKLMMASDRSVLRVLVSILPEEREIVARMSWAVLGNDSGFLQLPQTEDLVLVGMAEGDEENAFVMLKLSNREDKIPVNAASGDMVAKALTSTKLWLTSDTRINLTKGDDAPTEPLVLGNVLKTFLTEFLDSILNAAQIGQCAVGPVFLDPSIRTALVQYKTEYLETESSNIVSQLAFTERGGE
jgi:hypothetical protein